MYQPQPIDTSHAVLPECLKALEEKLARHNHDIWAQRRIEEGWRYGPTRDDEKKEHPCLIPYEELPESEKDYDRQTSAEALKAILAEGYQIIPPEPVPGSIKASELRGEPPVEKLVREIELSGANSSLLQALWQDRHQRKAEWESSPAPYRVLARQFLSIGAPLISLEVVTEGLQISKDDVGLRQLQGLALARTGAPERANKLLQHVRSELETRTDLVDPALWEETLGILARTHKDLGLMGNDQTQLRDALKLYEDAYNRTGKRYWTGINVATLATLLDETELATATAHEVRQRCLEALQACEENDPNRYWILATLGEAALNLRDFAEAESYYGKAGEVGRGRYGDLNSTRRQARILLAKLGKEETLANEWLPLPGVAVFSGHMVDQPTRAEERFPARFVDAVKNSIKNWIRENNIRIGFSSAACGSDILFQEALQELYGECHVVLPYEEKQFVADSVNITGNQEWGQRFKNVLQSARQVVYTSMQKIEAGSVSYDYANLVLHGLATVRARELETSLLGLVVWNGSPGDGPGGTASVVGRWHALGIPVSRIDLSKLPEPVPDHLPIVQEPKCVPDPFPVEPKESETEVMAMLFADAVNFGKLTEDEVPRFVQSFLGEIAKIVGKYAKANVVRNTWGDGLYLVFKTVRDAGICALELREMVQETDWKANKLPAELTLRIALHAGPVFGGIDPVTGNKNYTGTHVSRAARLEPKTPPGEVYASEAFAALVAVHKVDPETEFVCEYVKQLEWAKHYGTFPTYVVRKGPRLDFSAPTNAGS